MIFFFKTMTKLILRKPQEQQFLICSEKSQAAQKLRRSLWPGEPCSPGEGARGHREGKLDIDKFSMRKRKQYSHHEGKKDLEK